MSLINREDLMQTLGITDMDCEKCGWYSRTARQCKRGSDFEDACCAIDYAPEVVFDEPTIEPERKKGEWIYGEHDVAMCDGYRCNKCGFFVPWDYKHKSIDYINDYHFCPNCGADMREGEQE